MTDKTKNKNFRKSKKIEEIALEALNEAKARKLEEKKNTLKLQKGEINGPKGPEPTRYGDWERKGIVYDF